MAHNGNNHESRELLNNAFWDKAFGGSAPALRTPRFRDWRPQDDPAPPFQGGVSVLRGRLGRRLLFWILLISGINAVIATSIQLFLDYRRDLSDISEALVFIEQSQAPGIAEAAWNFDRNQLKVQLDGIARSPWISGALVHYGPNELASERAGAIDIEDTDIRKYPLVRVAGARVTPVGHLWVAPNLGAVYGRSVDRIAVVLSTQAVKTFVISLSLLFLVATMITRHLNRLAAFARRFSPGAPFVPLALDRGAKAPDDELNALAETFNQVCVRLNQAYTNEARHRERLEEEVEARTRDLAWAHNRLALSLRGGRLGSWDWDLRTGGIVLDERWAEMLGYDPAAPTHIDGIRDLIHPDDVDGFFSAVEDTVGGHADFLRSEFRLRARDGTWRWVQSGGMVVTRGHDGAALRLVGVNQDITDRKRAQLQAREEADRNRGILDTVMDGILILDDRGRIETLNPAAERLFGLTTARVTGQPVTVLLPALGERPGEALAELAGRRREIDGVGASGVALPLDLGVSETRIGGRRTFTACLHDISVYREAAKVKREFVSKVSHEVRTPMNAVIGMTLLALRTELSDRQRDYLEKIYQSSHSLLCIVNDILDFSKIEAGKLSLQAGAFLLDDVLNDVATVVRVAADEKGLELLFSVAPLTPRALVGDKVRIEQILINLVNNAIRFTDEGEIVIVVEPDSGQELQTAAGSEVVPAAIGGATAGATAAHSAVSLRFSVCDTGIGLGKDQISRLFQAFSQIDDSDTRQHGGTGLGLAICRQLAELMGGRIWVESEPGVGSSFRFTLRLGLAAPSAADTSESVRSDCSRFDGARSDGARPDGARTDGARRDGVRTGPEALTGKRVLVVDDSAAGRQVMASMLEARGCTVARAKEGAAALAMLERAAAAGRPFDLVVMDWRMPGMSGIETARRIRASASLSPVPAILMVTAFGREDVMREAQDVGLDGFLIKPVTEALLTATIGGIFGQGGPPRLPEPARTEPAHRAGAALAGRRVLLVEDNALNRQVARELMEDAGILVDCAENGREGVARVIATAGVPTPGDGDADGRACDTGLALTGYDLVLMDIQMPVMDGLTATTRIRADRRFQDLPIIAMTAHAMAGDRERSLEAGMNDHVIKPIDPDQFFATLARWLAPDYTATAGPERSREDGLVPTLPAVPSSPVDPDTGRSGQRAVPARTGPSGSASSSASSSVAGGAGAGYCGGPSDRWAAEGHDAGQESAAGVLDLDAALRILGGDQARLRRLLCDYRRLNRGLVVTLISSHAEGNLEELFRHAHSLKASAGYIGAHALVEAAATLEYHSRRGDTAATREAMPVVIEALDRVMAVLEDIETGGSMSLLPAVDEFIGAFPDRPGGGPGAAEIPAAL